jgi:lipopolysaccharide/colanic/teichoic acid biosynthesis glycosyltransferase
MIGVGLRKKLPSSRTRFFSRLAFYDLVWAGISPFLAFLIRDGTINRFDSVAIYCGIAIIASIVVFQWFKISSPISAFFSAQDARIVVQACLFTVALTAVVLFTFTRLEDAPRSVPFIHFFVLASGLLGERAIARFAATQRASRVPSDVGAPQNVIILEASRLAWFFTKMVEEFAINECRIVAILDERPWLYNRMLNGYSIVGSPAHIAKIIDEYATHGVEIHKVVVAAAPDALTEATWAEVRRECTTRNIQIEMLHEHFLFPISMTLGFSDVASDITDLVSEIELRPIWKIKRVLDIVCAVVGAVVIAPVAVFVTALVLIDVGHPVVFWQQRIGYLGRPLYVYKFRTMQASFDRKGYAIADTERLSSIGHFLRKTRLDEIPQLLNILVGNMSLIGPRPLLPIDQPKTTNVRLQVRPGLTGLAQINGGKLLSPEEKEALDEWYVRHASLLLDIEIIFRTMWVIVRGDRRDEIAVSAALAEKNKDIGQTA